MKKNLVKIPSSRQTFEAVLIGHPIDEVQLDITLCIRNKPYTMETIDSLNQILWSHPRDRKYLTRKEVTELFGSSDEDVETLNNYFKKFGIKIKSHNPLIREIELVGSVEQFEQAFNVQMGLWQALKGVTFTSYKGYLSVPKEIADIILHIEGFTLLPGGEYRRPQKHIDHTTKTKHHKQLGYKPLEIAKAYNYPDHLKGKGQTVGIVELSGRFAEEDLELFFKKNKIKRPQIILKGYSETPETDITNAEVTLDIEILGSIVPQAKMMVYFGDDLTETMKLIINDHENAPDVISISWAGEERNYDFYQQMDLNLLFFQAALLGITVIAASGDNGAYNQVNPKTNAFPIVNIPATNPFVLACGGTMLKLKHGKISSEVVWNEFKGSLATGGGFSTLYPTPLYQTMAIAGYPYMKFYSRGIPDVSAHAAMKHGYDLIFEKSEFVVGGTSSATPMWAGLIALLNQELGYNLGFINELLYRMMGTKAFNQVTKGNNNLYFATKDWNPCCGLGSPNGQEILEAIKKMSY